ncbi:MAG: hypothetical protein ACR2GM_07235 [Nocardioidaceae bacterium]
MAMTDLSNLLPPAELATYIAITTREERVTNHRSWVPLGWWNDELRRRQLPGGPVTGRDERGMTVSSGQGWISRDDVFRLADAALHDPSGEAMLGMVWHAFAWGSGTTRRLMSSRLDSIAADPAGSGQLLFKAAHRASSDPRAAYELLRPRGTAIRFVGPSFFTKVLYFSGEGRRDHRALILDDRVARALNRLGWDSLRTGPWPAITYQRYCDLLARWTERLTCERSVAADEIERWLFERTSAVL